MKSQDIYILLKLFCLQQDDSQLSSAVRSDRYSARSLAADLGVSKTEVNASIRRSMDSGMVAKDRASGSPRVNRQALMEFIAHGMKYVFPVKPGAMVRGVPTSFSAPVLDGRLMGMGEYSHVWPYAEGHMTGQSIKPLFKSAPEAAVNDDCLYGLLALVDAVRIGNAREASLARGELGKRLLNHG